MEPASSQQMHRAVPAAERGDRQSSSIGSICSGKAAQQGKEDERLPVHRKIHCSYKIDTVAEIFSKMEGHKAKLLTQCNFSGLMHLPKIENNAVKSVNRQLGFWLLMRLDVEKGEIDLGHNGKIPVTVQDVGLILGLSSIGVELVPSDLAKIENTKAMIKQILMIDESSLLDLDSVRGVLERDITDASNKAQNDAFIIASIIYATSYFLAPRGRPPRVNTDILEALLDPKNVCKINWSSYVLKNLKECSQKVKNDVKAQTKTVTLDGCLLVLQIAYLDNLNFGAYSTSQFVTPRVKYFTKEIMDNLTQMDKPCYPVGQDCRFGQTEIRPASETIYSRGVAYRQMLASMSEHCDIHTLIQYINLSNEEHKRRIKLQQRTFMEQQLKEIDAFNQQMNSVLKTWAAVHKIHLPDTKINTPGQRDAPEGNTTSCAGQEQKRNTIASATSQQDNNGFREAMKYNGGHDGKTTIDIGDEQTADPTKTAPEKRILLAQGNMLTFTGGTMLATNKRGRTKHVAPRKHPEKKKRADQKNNGEDPICDNYIQD